MAKILDEDTKEIISSFIAEGHERLDDAEAKLAGLGRDDDVEILNSAFRLFHSVKGSAGFLDFENVKSLTHEAETLLEVFLKEKIAHTPGSLDVLFETVDVLRSMIEGIEREYTDEAFTEIVSAQSAKIRNSVVSLRSGATAGDAIPADPSNEILLNELVTKDMVERFLSETFDLLDSAEKTAWDLEANRGGKDSVNSLFRAVHTIKGNAGFFGYALLERLCMNLENILDEARMGKQVVSDTLIAGVLKRIDGVRTAVRGLRIVEAGGASQESATSPTEYKPIGEILQDMGATDDDAIRTALDIQEKPIGEILVESGGARAEDIAKALEIQKSMGSAGQNVPDEIQRKEIRVDTVKLDKLFDLVGELITAEAMVLNSPDLAGLKLDAFKKSYAALNKISREIQETTMMIRMIPLEGLFHKMTRLVRDLSRKFDKKVDFIVSGRDTEMDKNVIEQISDPLVHIIRNAIDHGLENSAERRAAGKPEKGTLRLDARYEGSEIWISVRDDGKGLNRKRILEKAASKGMLQGDGSELEDQEVWRFIFAPGFSTAEKVSDISGRGVGMDVVNRNIEKIRGSVEIISEYGMGSEFILKIPLTMAIIEAITVRTGANHYSIPLADIIEFFRAKPEQITQTDKNEEVLRLRDELIPVLRLYEIFDVQTEVTSVEDGILLVLSSDGKKVCLLIDEVVGNQQIVIKSLSEYLGRIEGISGCTIMGDGTVSFIVDTGRLISLRLE